MDQSKNFDWLEKILSKILETAKAKNHDYSDGHTWSGNFEDYGLFGMMARMNDKVKRAENLIIKKIVRQVDEKVEDTLEDLAVYALLVRQAYIEGMPVFGEFTINLIEIINNLPPVVGEDCANEISSCSDDYEKIEKLHILRGYLKSSKENENVN